jgi:hypothetical protein
VSLSRALPGVTPDFEAQAQLHSGGIPGSYPVVFDFDYENEGKAGSSLEGILSFRDFHLCKSGDVTAWESSGFGFGRQEVRPGQ